MDFVDPPSGSVIANFEGTVNATTLSCNITNEGSQVSTQWSIENFRDAPSRFISDNLAPELFSFSGDPIPTVPNFTYRNRLTVLNWTSELDRVTVFCGTGADPEQANFVFRIYRKFSTLN